MLASWGLTLVRFAQAGPNYDYDYSTTLSQDEAAGFAIGFFIIGLITISLIALMIVAMWRVFEKAGKPGWASIIPAYNGWILAEVGGKPGWWGLIGLGGLIPLIGIPFAVAGFVLSILISVGVTKNFGKEDAFALLLIFVPFVGYPILGFGKAHYKPVHTAGSPAAS